jgi:hypothetical protein
MISFAAPWVLLGLLALPALWWLLRLIPPAPRRVVFPPLRILQGLKETAESARHMPPWLLALRLTLAACLILGAAHPLLDAKPVLRGQGPLILVVDDGWAAATGWSRSLALADALLTEADRAARPVALVGTARRDGAPPAVDLMTAEEARRRLAALKPKPWGTDRRAALASLDALAEGVPGQVVWLADGVEEGGMADLARSLRRLGSVTVATGEGDGPLWLRPMIPDGDGFLIEAERLRPGPARTVHLRAFGEDGRLLTRESLDFGPGETEAGQRLALPAELRSRLARLDIEGTDSASAVLLADEGWRRRAVGLASLGEGEGTALLDASHYLTRALELRSELRTGSVTELLERELSMVVLADGRPGPEEVSRLQAWVEAGGVLLRFAGPGLARSSADALLPVRLRKGDRALGGALAWREPMRLAPFAEKSPFAGLRVPEEVTVTRQILADPGPELEERAWARLTDGTPLVTGKALGKGWVVLVHTTAGPGWSSLALSGLFPEMLERVLDLSRGGGTAAADRPLSPRRTLDGFGRLGVPPDGALALAASAFATTPAVPRHPPGYYGEGPLRQAFNLAPSIGAPAPFADLPADIETRGLEVEKGKDLRPWFLGAALFLALADLGAVLLLLGRPLALVLVPLFAWGGTAAADDDFALAATAETRLAYVLTGDAARDETSRAGLFGLGLVVNRRTSVDLGAPVGVDLDRDDLSFFPLVHWPLAGTGGPVLTERAVAKVRAYLRRGGLILFDGREAGGPAPEMRDLAEKLDLPRLAAMPPDHVLTRSYYLLRGVVGRWEEGTVWIEEAGERINDGVPGVVAGNLDWAGAWAVDDALQPLHPVVPGGDRQREMAYRFGVNLLMVALTGNYKADQVHLPIILERLGR